MELREKIANITCDLCSEWCKDRPDSCPRRFSYADQIIQFIHAHYIELAEKEGLELTENEINALPNNCCDPCRFDEKLSNATCTSEMNIICAKCEKLQVAEAQLAKVMIWHEAEKAEVVQAINAERERILKELQAKDVVCCNPEACHGKVCSVVWQTLKGGK